jgi:hypothetical protein
MAILRIQHAVPSYDDWKRVFDSDPLDRKGSGVQQYEIHRPASDPNYVMVDLHFASAEEAELLHGRLRELWAGPGGALMHNPEGRVVETVASVQL